MRIRRPPVHWLAGLSLLPMLVWWLGWYPGFASSDTMDQWRQGLSGEYLNHHPPVHTLYLEVVSVGNTRPGLVTLFQICALAVLLVYAAKRLIEAGAPQGLAVGATLLAGAAPAVVTTTLSLWKDVVFGLCVLWAWIELLHLSRKDSPWDRGWPPVRLGLALAGVWAFRGNGPITVILLLLLLAWVHRRRFRRVVLPVTITAAAAFLLTTLLASLIGATGDGIDPSQVFLPDIAASFNSEPETFPPEDVALLTDLAPLETWTNRYTCYDSTPLLFDPSFDYEPLRSNPGAYRALVADVALRDPDSVLGHRACVANFLYSPAQPDDAYFHRPPYEIPPNTVGLTRARKSDRAFAITDAIWRWGEDHLWLVWRPAVVLIPTAATLAGLAARRTARHLLVPGLLWIAHLLNVALTSPAQELRYAYPLYVIGLLTLPLAWLLFRKEGSLSEPSAAR